MQHCCVTLSILSYRFPESAVFSYLMYWSDSSAGQPSWLFFLSQIYIRQRTLIILDFASVSVMKYRKRCQAAFLTRILSCWKIEGSSGGSQRSYAEQFEQRIQLRERRARKYPRNCHISEIQLRIYLNTCDWKIFAQEKRVTAFQYLKIDPPIDNLEVKIFLQLNLQ